MVDANPSPPRTLALTIPLALDAVLAIGFGLASWLAPDATIGTILDIQGAGTGEPLVRALLSSLSSFYIVIGLTAAVGALMPLRQGRLVAGVMAFRHAWVGIAGVLDAGSSWQIGNPWPDVAIHAAFVVTYLIVIGRSLRSPDVVLIPPAEGRTHGQSTQS